jgi:hypothetical protein
MVFRGLVAAMGLVLAMGASAGAAEPAPSDCSLSGRGFAVKPLYNYEDAGYTAFRQFTGAEVYVPAQPGLTPEWIDRVLTAQVANGECNFGVPRVDVEVLSDGGGFSVRLSGQSEKAAAEILRHTEQMAQRRR